MKLYLDLCSIQRPLDDQTQLRVKVEAVAVLSILEHCRTGGAELVSSDALVFEIGWNPHPDRRTFAETASPLRSFTSRSLRRWKGVPRPSKRAG